MTERGAGESAKAKHLRKNIDSTMADMNYRHLSEDLQDGSDTNDQPKPCNDGGSTMHAVNVEPTVEVGGPSTGLGPRRIRGGTLYKSVGCSRLMAICLLLLILVSILMIAIVASLARPRCISAGNSTSEALPVVKPTPALDTNGERFPWTDIRLPTNIEPLAYTIFLHPNLTTCKVMGQVAITLQATTESTNYIVLHTVAMNLTMPREITPSPEAGNSALKPIQVKKMQLYIKNEMVYFTLANNIPVGQKYVLNLDFNYSLGSGLKGFYRSTYTVGTETRVLATTQMEPTDARRAFPCFDEPNMKATFQITIIRKENHISLSNMPIRQSIPYTSGKTRSNVGLMQDDYDESVIMSTYLVAFVVCDFKSISDMTESPIPAKVAVYASEDKLEQTQLALDVLKYTIPKYEQYFGIKYPLPKQDMIAIPDFAAGAMENWGLITYRQSSILNKEGVTSDSSKQWIVQTITHELAHQWFGNLVTMDWWTDLWLNEGFATYVEYIGTDAYQQRDNLNWRMMDLFVIDTAQHAMYVDSMADSHPILVEVQSPGQINEIFDSISYSKGASIIRMLNDYVTENVFVKGLSSYLSKYKYANAKTVDLWNEISNARQHIGDHSVALSVADMMDTWTLQMGYPVVTLSRSGNTITATQKYFLVYSKAVPSKEYSSPFDYKWTIPLTVVTKDNPQPADTNHLKTALFFYNQESAKITITGNPRWYKGNYKQTGFYRVNYDDGNWEKLNDQLKEDLTVMSPTDRSGIIDDAFNLALADQLEYEVPLTISEYLRNEKDYIPWSAAFSGLNYIGLELRNKEGYTYYQQYVLWILGNLIDTIGWQDTGTHLEKKLRGSVLYSAVKFGHDKSVEQAQRMFRDWKENNVSVSANLKSIVYCAGVMYGQKQDWDFCWNKYQQSIIPTEKRILQRALACTHDPTLINKYLYLAIDKDQIRQQDSIGVIGSIADHAAGANAAVKFVIDNWDLIISRYGASSFDLSHLIGSVTSSISSQFEFEQIKSFLSKHSEEAKSGQRSIRQALETMQMNIQWLKDNEVTVTKWFKEKVTGINAQ